VVSGPVRRRDQRDLGSIRTARTPDYFARVPIHSSRSAPDVLVIGTGLIGLACAAAAAERGLNVLAVGEALVGAASLAAAGMLAPSIERGENDAADFAITARDRYPAYIDWLRDRSGIEVPLNRDGIIQVAVSDAGVRGLQRSMPREAEWLDARALHNLEPALSHGLGGVFHSNDGAVDNVQLYQALVTAVERESRVTVARDTVVDVTFNGSSVIATGRSGASYAAGCAVLAAGAWSNSIKGLPRPLPVEPVRGQMIAYATSLVRRCVYGPTGYVVPRPNGRTLVGATTERVGFQSITTPEGIARLEQTATEILPTLTSVAPSEAWAGLRPMSADLQPILGPDPDEPRLLYATGHSRNGVLMTPLTGDCIAALLVGEHSPTDIGIFSVARFSVPSR
jgi:glycine oxidase